MKTHSQGQSFSRHIPILCILAFAFLVRIVGINFGLPDLYHADEPIVVNHALAYGTGDLNPHFFKIPPLISYLLFIVYGFYFLAGSFVGNFKNADDFLNLFLSDPTGFYLLGRIVFGALIGTATVYLLYRLGRKFFSREHGLLSSFFLAVCFLHVRDSHYIYVDIPLLFLLLLSFFQILKILNHGGKKEYVLFGIIFGTAVTTKYNGVFLICPFLVAHLIRKGSIKLMFTSFVLSILVFFILNPFSLIDLKFFVTELVTQSKSETFSGFFHHFRYSLTEGMGIPLFYLSLVGILFGLFSRDSKRLTLLSFVVVYFVALTFLSQPYDRYVLPIIPFLCFFAADVLIKISGRVRVIQKWPTVFAAIIIIPSVAKIFVSDYLFLQKDVRTQAKEWIEQHIPADSKIALDPQFYSPRLRPNLKQILEKKEEALSTTIPGAQRKRLDFLAAQAEAMPNGRYELFFLADQPSDSRFLFSKPAIPYDLNDLKGRGIHYVALTQIDPLARKDFYDAVTKEGKLVAQFNPYRDDQIVWPMDKLPLTGGPFLWKDLITRKANGQTIKIYLLV